MLTLDREANKIQNISIKMFRRLINNHTKRLVISCLLTAGAGCFPYLATAPTAKAESAMDLKSSNMDRKVVICVRTNDKWVGFISPNKLYYALLDLEAPCVLVYKETTLSEDEAIILNRFLISRKLFKNLKKNEEISKKQIELVTGISSDNKNKAADLLNLDIREILKKTTHISVWDQGEFTELTLATTDIAKKEWPNHLSSFLNLLFSPSSRSEKVESEGIGFLVPLDKPKKIGEQISWASTLRSLTYEFEPVNNDCFKSLPQNLKTMLNYNGFIVPMSTDDLKLMSKLKWDVDPESLSESTGIPLEKSGIIWWGLIEYKGKNYGINAWKTCGLEKY